MSLNKSSSNHNSSKNDAKLSMNSIPPVVPMSRVKTIMKSSPEVSNINQDTLYLVCKATEQFIHFFTNEAHKNASKEKNLDYKHLSSLVTADEKFQFLAEIIPPKIKAREALAMIEAEKNE